MPKSCTWSQRVPDLAIRMAVKVNTARIPALWEDISPNLARAAIVAVVPVTATAWNAPPVAMDGLKGLRRWRGPIANVIMPAVAVAANENNVQLFSGSEEPTRDAGSPVA